MNASAIIHVHIYIIKDFHYSVWVIFENSLKDAQALRQELCNLKEFSYIIGSLSLQLPEFYMIIHLLNDWATSKHSLTMNWTVLSRSR